MRGQVPLLHRPHWPHRARMTFTASMRLAASRPASSTASRARVTVDAHRRTIRSVSPRLMIMAASAVDTALRYRLLLTCRGRAGGSVSTSLRTSTNARRRPPTRTLGSRSADTLIRIRGIRSPKGCECCTPRAHGQAVNYPTSNCFASRSAQMIAGSSSLSPRRKSSVASISLAMKTSLWPNRSKVSATAEARMLRARNSGELVGSVIPASYSVAQRNADNSPAATLRHIAVERRLSGGAKNTAPCNPIWAFGR